ncbi:TPA: replication initiator protein A [Streptococcus pneumoniae]
MDFEYFYNREAERFNFLKVPEILVDREEFRGLSAEAIILYSILLKQTGMSFKNNWIDKEGRVFIYFTVEEIMKRRNISKPTAIKTLDELDVKAEDISDLQIIMNSQLENYIRLPAKLES